MGLLEDRVAVVTGAANGIGRAIAETFAGEGARVVVADVLEAKAAEVTAGIKERGFPEALPLKLDVTDEGDVEKAVGKVVNKFGRLDILVNNAAVLKAHPIVDFPLEEWQQIFRVNMEGTFLCSRAAAREMIARQIRGSIINIASASSRKADSKHAAYSSTKAAIVAFTRILALELGEHGIRANAILPGATETEMLQGVFRDVPGIREDLISKTVLGKLATPADQANGALFLASDLASHITGEYLVISGGEFMNA